MSSYPHRAGVRTNSDVRVLGLWYGVSSPLRARVRVEHVEPVEHVEELGQARHFWQAMDTFAARVSTGDAGFDGVGIDWHIC